MDGSIKNRINSLFSWSRDPADAFGAPALMEQEGYWDEIDLNDDDDVEALMGLALTSMRIGQPASADFVKYLVSKGFDINTRLPDAECLLLQGADSRVEPEVIQQLIDLGADVYAETRGGDNILTMSAKKDYDDEDKDGRLPIYIAERFDLSRLNTNDRLGITPLMYAALLGHVKLARALIEHGADVNAPGAAPVGNNGYWIKMDGVTPLALACRSGSVEIAQMLLEAGADETIRDAKGNPPIFSLLRYPHRFFERVRINDPIFERKCRILALLKELELTDAQGYTVLMRSLQDSPDFFDKASAYDNLPITLALIQRGADIEHTGNDGKRPLHLAIQALGDAEKKLVKAGAELNVQDNEGNTPLLIACKRCGEKEARYLIKAGADFSIQNNKGETAMSVAAERGFSDALELMMGG